MEQLTALAQTGWDMLLVFLTNNWSLIASVLVAFVLIRVLKASIHIVLFIIFVGLALAICTNMGLLPPINEIIQEVRSFVGI